MNADLVQISINSCGIPRIFLVADKISQPAVWWNGIVRVGKQPCQYERPLDMWRENGLF